MVLVPGLYLVTEPEGANIVSFVEQGGVAVVSFWSGIVDQDDAVHLGLYGGPLRPLMGCEVLEVAPQGATEALELEWEDGARRNCHLLDRCGRRRQRTFWPAFAHGPWAGRPVVVETEVGRGRAYYVSASPGRRRPGPGVRPHPRPGPFGRPNWGRAGTGIRASAISSTSSS